MNSIKRLFISLKGQIDQAADDFENHEALAGVAIQDLLTTASKIRLDLHRIATLTKSYQTQLGEQQKQTELWTQRATKAKQHDPKIALQCVKRLRETLQKITLLEQQYQESSQQQEKIRNDLNEIEQQLAILKNKKAMFAVRQNRSDLQATLQANPMDSLESVQGVFERWENKLVGTEANLPIEIDHLSSQFEQEEEMLELQKMLDDLDDTHLKSKGE